MLQLELPIAMQFNLTPRAGVALAGIFQTSSNQSSPAEVRPAEVRPAKVCYNTQSASRQLFHSVTALSLMTATCSVSAISTPERMMHFVDGLAPVGRDRRSGESFSGKMR